jgi:hypothetical protein
MIDLLPALITVNVLITVFYSSYALPQSPIHKDGLKSIFGATLVAFFGLPLVVIHMFRKGNNNE